MPRRSTNVLGQLLNSIAYSAAGKITWYSNMWAIIGSRWDKKRIQNKNLKPGGRVNENGELVWGNVVLVRRLCTFGCPKPPGDDFYMSDKGQSQVPATECRKCPYHRASNRQFRFPRCVFGKGETMQEVAQVASIMVNDVMTKAIDKTNKVLGQ